MIASFADNFRPTTSSHTVGSLLRQASDGSREQAEFLAKIGKLIVSPGQEFDTTSIATAREQIKHYKLWNYIACQRIATKLSSLFPVVASVGTTRSPKSLEMQSHLATNYSHVLRQNASDELLPVSPTHPLCELFANVNPVDWWGSFAYEMGLMLELTGVAYIWTIKNGFGVPAEMWVIPSHWVKPVYDQRTKLLKHWLVVPDGDTTRKMILEPDEVEECKYKNPASKILPFSPTQAIAEWIVNSERIEFARDRAFRNGPLSHVILEIDGEFSGQVTPDEITEIGRRFVRRYNADDGDNAYAPIVQPPGVKAKPWGHSPKEMDFEKSSNQVRDQILGARGVPKVIAGITDDVNKASIFGANMIFCSQTITPLAAFIAGFLTEQVASKFDPSLRVYFAPCIPHDEDAAEQRRKNSFAMGAWSPDEQRLSQGLEPLETKASQQTYIPIGFAPLSDFEEGNRDADGEQRLGSISNSVELAAKPTPKQRRLLRQFHRVQGRHENLMHKSARQFWDGVIGSAKSRVKNGERKPAKILGADFGKKFNKLFKPQWTQAIVSGAQFEAALHDIDIAKAGEDQAFNATFGELVTQADKVPDINVEVSDDLRAAISDEVKRRGETQFAYIEKTAREKLGTAIETLVADGASAAETIKGISETLDVLKSSARTIARTEATGTVNAGQQSIRDIEEIPYKSWIDTADDNTRESHSAAGGQRVKNDKPFSVGSSKMMHPGDGSLGADAKEIILCRCGAFGEF